MEKLNIDSSFREYVKDKFGISNLSGEYPRLDLLSRYFRDDSTMGKDITADDIKKAFLVGLKIKPDSIANIMTFPSRLCEEDFFDGYGVSDSQGEYYKYFIESGEELFDSLPSETKKFLVSELEEECIDEGESPSPGDKLYAWLNYEFDDPTGELQYLSDGYWSKLYYLCTIVKDKMIHDNIWENYFIDCIFDYIFEWLAYDIDYTNLNFEIFYRKEKELSDLNKEYYFLLELYNSGIL